MVKIQNHLIRLRYYWFTKILQEWKLFKNNFFFFSLDKIVFSILRIFVLISSFAIVISSIFWLKNVIFLQFAFSTKGFIYFNSTLNPYKEILTISFSIIGLYLIIIQIRQGYFSNKIGIKEKWVVEINKNIREKLKYSSQDSAEIIYSNSEIIRHIELNAEDMFDFLFNYNMKISNKFILRKFFVRFIISKIVDFENSAIENIIRDFKYSEYENIPPSLLHFRSINDYIIKPSEGYTKMYEHFEKMYTETFEIIKNTVGDSK